MDETRIPLSIKHKATEWQALERARQCSKTKYEVTYTQRKIAERVCMDIREELTTWCRGMERPGHEITHIGGTPILTYSMEHSPSWEANWFAASQEIPRILWNLKVHYGSHEWPPPVPIPSQLDPVHTPTSHFLKIHLNIILPSMPGSPQWSLSPRFPHQNPVYASPLPHTRYMPCPSHFSWFYHPHIFFSHSCL